jgi:hypothetical protein
MKYHNKPKQLNCQHCAMGKHKRKPIPKYSANKATRKGERMGLDVTSVKGTSFGGAKFWLMLQDEYTDFIWSIFIKSKDMFPNQWIEVDG